MINAPYRTVQELLTGRFAAAWTEDEAHNTITDLDDISRATNNEFEGYCFKIATDLLLRKVLTMLFELVLSCQYLSNTWEVYRSDDDFVIVKSMSTTQTKIEAYNNLDRAIKAITNITESKGVWS